MEVALRHQNYLQTLKDNIEKSVEYFRDNAERYNSTRKFVFCSNLDPDDISLLKTLKKPTIEFNIQEAFVSRLRGEFSKQEPSIEVMAGYETPVDPQVIKIVEGHFKQILCDANNNGFEYQIYTDQLSGGYSAFKVITEYVSEKSFDHIIKMMRCYDPTMCGWDPMAKIPHKGDGEYCFELFPMRKDDFKRDYPDAKINDLKFSRNVTGFSWSYKTNQRDDIIVIADIYIKKKKKTKVVKLSNGKVLTKKEYDEFAQKWQDEASFTQMPEIVKERQSTIVTICRYRLIENQVLEYDETDYKELPIVFVDGSSIEIRENKDGDSFQMTRPYVYQGKGAQKLKNFAGQTLANELENMIMHQWIISNDSLPKDSDYLEAYTNPQQASVLVFNEFKNNNPDVRTTPPREVSRIPIPPEVTNTFTLCDNLMQTVFGSYDAQLGINKTQLSGVAIVEGATQSNSTAMPYIVGFLQGLQQAAKIVIDLIPKYYVTPRTIPVMDVQGKRSYVPVNQQNGIQLDYGENALNVKVEAGVNFAIQKNQAVAQMISMMQASPLFAEFMNTEGLEELLDNLEFRGVDSLKIKAAQWLKQKKEQAQKQPNPMQMKIQLEQQKLMQEAKESQLKAQLQAAELTVKNRQIDNDQMKIMAEMGESRDQISIAHDKADAEKARAAVDYAIKVADLEHRHTKDVHETHHKHAKESAELHLKHREFEHKKETANAQTKTNDV